MNAFRLRPPGLWIDRRGRVVVGAQLHVLDRRLGRPPRPATFPVAWPLVALDWVQTERALRSISAHTTPAARLASDHLPVVAEIDMAATSPFRNR